MKVIWTREALADLADIATYYTTNASPSIAEAVGRRFVDVVERIRNVPFRRHALRTGPKSGSQRSFAILSGYFTGSEATTSTSSIFATRPDSRSRD